MTNNKEKTFIFVIGMHRSGTSLVANLLNKAGVFLGETDDLLPPNFDNRYGFYENKNIIDINDSILKKFNLKWDTTETLDFRKDVDLTREKLLAKNLVREVSFEHDVLAFKDPRTTLTLPFWRDIVGEEIKILFAIRNPLEIYESLEKRNSFSKNKSLKIWENYIKQGLENINGLEALFVNYQDILNNPFPNFVRILQFLDIEYNNNILKKMYFTLAPEVKHSTYNDIQFIEDKDVTNKQKALLETLELRYHNQMKNHPLEEVGIEVSLEEKIDHLKNKMSNIGERLDICRRDYIAKKIEAVELTRQNRDLTRRNKDLTRRNKDLTRRNKDLTRRNKDLTRRNKDLNILVSDKTNELEKVYRSKSWKITSPMRSIAQEIRNLKCKVTNI